MVLIVESLIWRVWGPRGVGVGWWGKGNNWVGVSAWGLMVDARAFYLPIKTWKNPMVIDFEGSGAW